MLTISVSPHGMAARAVALTALMLAGCAPRLAVRVAMTRDYPPFCQASVAPAAWHGRDGLDVRLMRRLAMDLGWSARVTDFAWPRLSGLMRAAHTDVAACGITVRRDRLSDMLFTRPYAFGGAVAVILPRNARRFPDVAALTAPGTRLAVNAGGHLERVARATFPRASLHTVSHNLKLPDELRHGRADAVISDSFEATRWKDLRMLEPFTRDSKALALPLDQAALRDAINPWLAAREADGWLPALRREQGVGGAGVTPAAVCAEALSHALEARFAQMPRVAAIKRRLALPVFDPAQERRVLDTVRRQAQARRLDVGKTERLFRVLMEQARSVQGRAGGTDIEGQSLESMRKVVAASSAALLQELDLCDTTLSGQAGILRESVTRRLGDLLEAGEIERLIDRLPPRERYRDPAVPGRARRASDRRDPQP